MILGLTPLFFSIWMDNPLPMAPGVAIARSAQEDWRLTR